MVVRPDALQDALEEPARARVAAAVAAHAPAASSPPRVEASALGVFAPSLRGRPAALRALERALADRPLRIFDFQMGPSDLAENVQDRSGFRAGYAGVSTEAGGRVFRADHHHDVPALARESTTPLVLRWLLALHDGGQVGVLAEVASARYLADHCDVDILFPHHLARCAEDRAYLEAVGPVLALAARQNDHLEVEDDARATLAYYVGVELERAIQRKTGDAPRTFAEVVRDWLPALGARIRGAVAADSSVGRALERLAEAGAAREQSVRERIEGWYRAGSVQQDLEGRLWRLEAPDEVDNAIFFLWVRDRLGVSAVPSPAPAPAPRAVRPAADEAAVSAARPLQLLSFPARGGWVHKLRAHSEDANLLKLFQALSERLPGAAFAGRATAGGSGLSGTPYRGAAVADAIAEILHARPNLLDAG